MFLWITSSVAAKSTPSVVRKVASSSVVSKKLQPPLSPSTVSMAAVDSSSSGASIASSALSSGSTMTPGVQKSSLRAAPKTPIVPSALRAPTVPNAIKAPTVPTAPNMPSEFGSITNTMSNLTTANTNISMTMGNVFGPGATITGVNFGNVNVNVAPSVLSSGPAMNW